MCGLVVGGWGQQALPVQTLLVFHDKHFHLSKCRVVASMTRVLRCASEESGEFFGDLPMGDRHGEAAGARMPLLTPSPVSSYSAFPVQFFSNPPRHSEL